jgi:hypothetical protein
MTEELDDFEDLFESIEEETIETIDEEFLPPSDDFTETEDDVIKDEPVLEDEDPEEEDEPEKEEEVSYFDEVAKGLSKLGKFVDIPEGTKLTEETFLEYFDSFTKQKAAADIEEILTDKWGDEGIEMFNDIFIKKVPIKDYLELKSSSTEIDKLDLENTINQRYIVKTYLEKTGMDSEEIEEQLETLEETDRLKTRAEKYKSKLIEDNETRAARMAEESEVREREARKVDEAKKTAIRETLEESVRKGDINGIPLSVKDKELLGFITAPAYKLSNGNTISEFDKQFFDLKKDPNKLIALAKLIKEGLNVTPIKNKAVDEKKEEVFDFKNKTEKRKSVDVESTLDLIFGKTKRK